MAAAAAPYVSVRITDLRDLDVANVRFDFDLTFAALLMHADGTIYHRYGSRGPEHAAAYVSLDSLAQLLRDTLAEHQAYDRDPHPPALDDPVHAIDLPEAKRRIANGQRFECVHCHTVNDFEFPARRADADWTRDRVFVFPDPRRLGVTLDPERQRRIAEVEPDTPAAAAGLRAGDELLALGEQSSVRTLADAQWALHRAPAEETTLALRARRGDREFARELTLPAGWKRCDPREYAWRPYKWNLSPAPGFGGPPLDAAAKRRLGIDADRFAFRVQYVVDWGPRRHRGRSVRAAGIRKGDVVVSFGGRDDFTSMAHFHAWVRLTRTVGEAVEVVVLRDGERRRLTLTLPR